MRVMDFNRGGDQEPESHSDRAPEILLELGEPAEKDNHVCSTSLQQAFLIEWPDGVYQKVLKILSDHEKQSVIQ